MEGNKKGPKMKQRFKILRKRLGITQGDLAACAGVSTQYIKMIETGTRRASDKIVRAICQSLNVREEWLNTGSGRFLVDSAAPPPPSLALLKKELAVALFESLGENEKNIIIKELRERAAIDLKKRLQR